YATRNASECERAGSTRHSAPGTYTNRPRTARDNANYRHGCAESRRTGVGNRKRANKSDETCMIELSRNVTFGQYINNGSAITSLDPRVKIAGAILLIALVSFVGSFAAFALCLLF